MSYRCKIRLLIVAGRLAQVCAFWSIAVSLIRCPVEVSAELLKWLQAVPFRLLAGAVRLVLNIEGFSPGACSSTVAAWRAEDRSSQADKRAREMSATGPPSRATWMN